MSIEAGRDSQSPQTPAGAAASLTEQVAQGASGGNGAVALQTIDLTLGTLPNTVEAKADTDKGDNNGSATRGTDVAKLGLTVAPAGGVAGAGKEGDVILEVAGKTVASAGDVRDAITAAKNDNKNVVLMRVKSGGQSRFVAVPLAKG